MWEVKLKLGANSQEVKIGDFGFCTQDKWLELPEMNARTFLLEPDFEVKRDGQVITLEQIKAEAKPAPLPPVIEPSGFSEVLADVQARKNAELEREVGKKYKKSKEEEGE